MNQDVISNYAFVCDSAFASDMGKLNIIGIFREIKTKELPFVFPQMFIVSSVGLKGKGVYEQKISIVRLSDDKEIVAPISYSMNVVGDELTEFGLIGQQSLLKFEEAGNYEVRIWLNMKLVNKIPFVVKILQ